MSVLLQVSDTHFGTEQAVVVAALQELVREQCPDVLLLSGDITQRARRAEFAAARRFVNQLAIPRVLALPGNHDIPLFNLFARLHHPYANYQRSFGNNLAPVLETEELLVIGVNTTRAARHKDGEVSAAQIDDVAQRLRRAQPLQLRIVVTHQPVHVFRERDAANLLHGHEAAVHAWATAGADLILGGHIHLPYVRPLRERYPALSRNLWCVQAGTAVSSRIRAEAPNSVNLIRVDVLAPRSQCSVERWDYRRATGFALAQQTAIELDRTSFV